MAAVLVFVRGMHLQRRVEPQQAVEQAVVERIRIPCRQVGTSGAADEQGIAREHTVLDAQTHRVARVPGSVQRLQAQASHHQQLAVIEAQIDERRRAQAMHRDRNVESARKLLCGGEMVGVRVRVDDVVDAQSIPRRQGEIAVDETELRIDEHGSAALRAPEQIGLATPGAEMFEDHAAPDVVD